MAASKNGQPVGVPVYDRKWVKFTAEEVEEITEVPSINTFSNDRQTPEATVDLTIPESKTSLKESPVLKYENDWSPVQTQATKCEILGISAATGEGEKHVLLTVRLNPYSYEVTQIIISLEQARERLKLNLANLVERHPMLNGEL